MIIRSVYGHGGDIYHNRVRLDFSANVNPLGAPEAVKRAVRDAADHIDVYPDPYCGALREKLSKRNGVDADEIICGNGAAELIYQFFASVKPKRVLLPVPSFSDYASALDAAGCSPECYPLLRQEGFAVTERFLDSITEETDCVMIASPNNPTGRTIEPALLLDILNRCREKRAWLFLDESFLELTDENKAYTLSGSLTGGDLVMLLRAFTKAYGMAGVRLGYAITKNMELLEAMSRASQAWNVSSVAQAAGLAALDCPDWPKQARTLVAGEKPYLMRELKRLGISVLPGDANFIMLTGVPGLCEKLLAHGILIRNCKNYQGLTEGDCRIAVRTRAENEALIMAVREVWHA